MMMQISALTILLMIFTLHSFTEAAEEKIVSLSSNHESNQHNVAAPSRVKRGNYDMMRLTRGLNMLRLGKRGVGEGGLSPAYPEYQDSDRDNILTLERIAQELQQSPYVYDISPEDFYKALSSFQDGYSHSRYRRSTPSDNMMVTPVPLLAENDDGDDKVDNGDSDDTDAYILYPDFADDSVIVDDNGKVWDGKSGEELSKRAAMNLLRLGKRQMESLNTEFTDGGDKRSVNMLRLGKRNLNMLRLGKRLNGEGEEQKRNLNMLRLGKKRNLNMLRLGKRQLNMLRLGKRQLNMLRLGKRQLNMLRLGKREDISGNEASKRNLQMLRLGKRPSDGGDKRNFPLLRLGKRSVDNAPVNKEE